MLKPKFPQCQHFWKVFSLITNTILVRAKTIKLLGEIICINLPDLGLGKDFLAMTLKTREKLKMDKVVFTKIKNVCASKDTIKKMKR